MNKILRIIEKTTKKMVFVYPAITLNAYDEAWKLAVQYGLVNAEKIGLLIVIDENINSNIL